MNRFFNTVGFAVLLFLNAGCSQPMLEDVQQASDYTYQVGPGDSVNIFVWGNPELSTSAVVRPDGKITVPLVEELLANGKTPFELAREIEKVLATYVKSPQVVVMVSGFKGVNTQQIRVIGRIGGGSSGGSGSGGGGGGTGGGIGRYQGKTIPYERGMSLLDVVIQIGLNQYADGNRSTVIRNFNGELKSYGVRIDDLIDDADLSANVLMMPGDILIIPDAYF
ncbi:polysaccharide biosynthesis/export family protein [Methylomonas sp. MED-D]|uniref:Sugar transporter n=1 Tax=Methylomonas koyamae TaxID=702114 RepID=A0A177PG05_9GAMM|nr:MULTISPECIES: polysaccharide biosynthesis/export family protein [Methylomonas]NJA07883.1 sugar transporter [Methylococcaceae bacterium WWC4]MDT4332285.1 polysaccharide biosynthesis/export family protein [Methylomonas sp. MV1]OAI29225.1 sugar transporter [Methylomonas koyamae]OHX37649.1 sugar transporter [Methylomonas sp. LWB]WGS85543.1 polysaccharide biosynthesis/export family protein [Methylomonas sp. UP202]